MSVDGPLSDRSLVGLRCTAAAVVALPRVQARLVHRGRSVLEIVRPPFDANRGHPVLPPCAFHRAVARAHQLRRSGERLALRGVPHGEEPAIEWGVLPGDLALPGSMVRIRIDDVWCHAAAVALPLATCQVAVGGDDGGPPGLGYHADHAVDATLLHIVTPRGDEGASREALLALEIAVARASVHELVEHLDATVPDSPATMN